MGIGQFKLLNCNVSDACSFQFVTFFCFTFWLLLLSNDNEYYYYNESTYHTLGLREPKN